MPIVLVVISFVLALVGTLMMEALSPRIGLIQAPNARSSHTHPTARGGGLAIALASIAGGFAFASSGGFLPVLFLVAFIAALGFLDDLSDLSPAIRFPLQAVIFAALIWILEPMPPMLLGFGLAFSGWLLTAALLVAGLWWLNLFNFMDGIDGIAGSQAVLLLVCGATLWGLGDANAGTSPVFWFMLVSAAATFGFLMRNWPPAKIFMGDAGSNSVALLIFFAALWTISKDDMSYQSWLIIAAVFITDATVTLLRRMILREKPWHAHRRHAYQQLSRRWGHRKTTLLYAAITLAWTFPLALVAQRLPDIAWHLVFVVYGPLIVLAFLTGAGSASEA